MRTAEINREYSLGKALASLPGYKPAPPPLCETLYLTIQFLHTFSRRVSIKAEGQILLISWQPSSTIVHIYVYVSRRQTVPDLDGGMKRAKGEICKGELRTEGRLRKGSSPCRDGFTSQPNRPHSGIIVNILSRGTDKGLRTCLDSYACRYNRSTCNPQLPLFLPTINAPRTPGLRHGHLRDGRGKGSWTNNGTN